MKPQMLVLALLGTLLVFAPTTTAAPTEAPAGLNVLVASDDGVDATLIFKFPLASDDPNQDTGDYQYNLTLDGGTPVDLGDIETLSIEGSAGDGFIIAYLETSVGFTYDAWIHAWDGLSEGPDSCTVTFDTDTVYDYDSCGTMDPTYEVEYCLSLDEGEDFGFATTHRVSKSVGQDTLVFHSGDGTSAYGGLNLGRDSSEYEFDLEVRSDSDGARSKILFFLSEVQTEANSISAADGKNSFSTGFSVPQGGSFASGYGVVFKEDGADYEMKAFRNIGGVTTVLAQETWSAGINANSFTRGSIKVSNYANVYEITLGDRFARFPLTETGLPENFWTFWITEYGGEGSFFNVNAKSRHTIDSDGDTLGCLSTLDASLGGATAATGAPSTTVALEDFAGEGGALSGPTYPGIDMEALAEDLEVNVTILGWMFFGLNILILGLVGFLAGGRTGIGVATLLLLPLNSTLGLNPLWLVVLVFMGAIAYTMLKKGNSAEAFPA